MKTSAVLGLLIVLCLLSGCIGMDNDGLSCDDGAATLCGIAGIIAFLVAVAGERKSGGLAFVGVILILA